MDVWCLMVKAVKVAAATHEILLLALYDECCCASDDGACVPIKTYVTHFLFAAFSRDTLRNDAASHCCRRCWAAADLKKHRQEQQPLHIKN